jgi:hypothetical protein
MSFPPRCCPYCQHWHTHPDAAAGNRQLQHRRDEKRHVVLLVKNTLVSSELLILQSPLGVNNHLGSALRGYYLQAGIKATRYGAHAIRHAFATRLIEQGTPMKDIADLLGHRSIETTFLYTKVAADQAMIALCANCSCARGRRSWLSAALLFEDRYGDRNHPNRGYCLVVAAADSCQPLQALHWSASC